MHKRVLCFLLSAAILLGLFCGMTPTVSAESYMSTTEKGIELIKKLEGFVSKPYYDYHQWSVGYGTKCPEEDLVRYQTQGITLAEADALLREYVAGFEEKLNAFVGKYSLTLNQQQFDALISFTYNLGSDWMNNESTFRTAVLNGSTGNDFLFAIARWCTANNEIVEALVKRRLLEANLYLNGVYSNSVPENYQYVIFNNVLENVVNDVRIQAYDSTKTSSVRATASKSGYHFLGWYTAAEGGALVTSLGPDTTLDTLYAHWQDGDGELDSAGNVVGTAARYPHTITDSAGQVIRKQPGINSEEIDKLNVNETVTIVADYIDEFEIRWAKLSTGGWINMSEPDSGDDSTVEILEEPATVTVVNEYVNIRSGAGTEYTLLGTANRGDQMTITKTKVKNGEKWGRFTGGWISLTYTDFDVVMEERAEDANVVTAIGVVNVEKLNVRSGPGTKYALVGSLVLGEEVEITLQKTVGVMVWGKISTGWIWLDCVDLIWEDVCAGNHTSTTGTVTKAATCSEAGTMECICSVCGIDYVKELPALGHSYDKGIITKAATCQEFGIKTFTCTVCRHSYTEELPLTDHICANGTVTAEPTCTKPGTTAFVCEVCGESYTSEMPQIVHNYVNGNCTMCGAGEVYRIFGETRYETAFGIADAMKEELGVEKFETIIVASGTSFADALSGSYLASVKNAPILITDGSNADSVKSYIKENLKSGGMVYLLGGTAALPESMETGLDGFEVKRLWGDTRYETNLEILKEAGIAGQEILICTGTGFADSLSASATKKPILLVSDKLTDGQKNLLSGASGKMVIIGGGNAVSSNVEQELKEFGTTERIGGDTRYETSVLVAKRFFSNPKTAVLAYAWNFPDGLCGGPLAAAMDAPMILTDSKQADAAAAYAEEYGVLYGSVLGGTKLIADDAVRYVFGLTDDTQINVK